MARPPHLFHVLRETFGLGGALVEAQESFVLGARGVAEAIHRTLPYTRLLLRSRKVITMTHPEHQGVRWTITRTNPTEVPDGK